MPEDVANRCETSLRKCAINWGARVSVGRQLSSSSEPVEFLIELNVGFPFPFPTEAFAVLLGTFGFVFFARKMSYVVSAGFLST